MYQTSLNRAEKIHKLLLELIGNSDKFTSVKYNNTFFENVSHSSNEECCIFLSKGMKSVEYYPNTKFIDSEYYTDVQLFSYSREKTPITLKSHAGNHEDEIIQISDFNEELYFQYSTLYEPHVLDALVLFQVLQNSDSPYFTCWLDQMDEIENAIRRTA